ncbi:bifunctional 4-hydroxy-3-methylbut-2-enyl diphosphate reductase/30S ribosomal protein S1 [Neomoorella humiferrea]|uniref:bifunctional 4-hydroxy-3-methylbut-2-enyl diphosphate reductase/30S ribosomal protein S1 n=1 Tax=Neomoorella humiferrea TaxID=676965 RepID=UPI001FE3777C|nr:bifunctional 4-hydroxy-3-methylbut-2-enyl diphosphate reductase/30S ribosomal protein S1 [Moorella humiferrea]
MLVADYAGFCFGVTRAVKKAKEAPKPIASLGSLIHNRLVVEELAREGVKPVASLEEVDCGRVLIRSHGVSPDVLEVAREKGLEVIDATCPYVARAQHLAQKLAREGYQVVIVGEASHPEVKGLLGWAGPGAVVVSDREEAELLPYYPRRAVLAQTTQPEEKLAEVAAVLRTKTDTLVVHNTVCHATRRRQEAAVDLARRVDVMLVVGGRESANTRHLAELCRTTGTPTYHIETAGELCRQWFINARRVGVTGGASTPAWIIEEVVVMLAEQEKLMVPEGEREPEKGPEGAELAPAGENNAVEVKPETESGATTVEAGETDGAIENTAAPEKQEEQKNEIQQQIEAKMPELRRGSIVTGTVVQVNDNEVLVDVGGKCEGIIPLNELSHRNISDPHEVVAVGDTINVMVVKPENEEGHPVLSKRRADRRIAWEKLEQYLANGTEIQGEVIEVVKGGLLVDVGVRGFVPASLIERGYVEDLNAYLGKTLRLRVIELDRSKNKVVLSQKAILEEEYEKQRQATWESLEVGQVRKGIVRRLTNFGAFVDLGGVDGLLHVSEISWGRVEHPRDALQEGQEIEVKVLGVDREEGKVSLGRKQLLPNPWDTAASRYPVGTIVEGKVLRLAPFGAFVEVEPGIEGLVHISQLADRHVEKPEDVVKVGDVIPVKVLGVDQEAQRMSLSLRQALRDRAKKQPKQAEKSPEPQEESGVKLGDLFGELFEEVK